MAIVNGEIIRTSVIWVYQNIAYQMNTLHLQFSDIAAQTAQQIRDDIEDYLLAAYTNITGEMTDQLVHNRVDLYSIQNAAPEDGIGAITLLNGASFAQALPLQLAAEIYFRTGVSRHIGRIFCPTFTEAGNDAGILTTGVRNNMTVMAQYLLQARTMANGTTITYGILDRSSGIFRQPGSAVVPIHFRTQRRRRIGVGI